MPDPILVLQTNFRVSELSCRCGCRKPPDPHLTLRLQTLRDYLNKPLVINSGARCEAYNTAVGGEPGSLHLQGLAVDIKCLDSAFRLQLIEAALRLGFTGIGVKQGMVHIDLRPSIPVFWLYPTS
ncbi:MAG: D-Ala-D-Ala carboxypeptidase family metallohydrolase [Desulfobacterales bacterium]|nr:D-Ala-D-Ala carboxypeptidase family metallohydrolase [Desulfobacterales bacterium]